MKKNITFYFKAISAAALLFLGLQAAAKEKDNDKANGGKEAAFVKGSKTLGLSVGFGLGYSYYGDVVSLPAIGLMYDQGIVNNVGPGTIGVGGILAIKAAHYNYNTGGYKATWTNYIIGVRGTYHLTILKNKNNKFDPYAGVTLGVRIYR